MCPTCGMWQNLVHDVKPLHATRMYYPNVHTQCAIPRDASAGDDHAQHAASAQYHDLLTLSDAAAPEHCCSARVPLRTTHSCAYLPASCVTAALPHTVSQPTKTARMQSAVLSFPSVFLACAQLHSALYESRQSTFVVPCLVIAELSTCYVLKLGSWWPADCVHCAAHD